jgi:hypothetical protein
MPPCAAARAPTRIRPQRERDPLDGERRGARAPRETEAEQRVEGRAAPQGHELPEDGAPPRRVEAGARRDAVRPRGEPAHGRRGAAAIACFTGAPAEPTRDRPAHRQGHRDRDSHRNPAIRASSNLRARWAAREIPRACDGRSVRGARTVRFHDSRVRAVGIRPSSRSERRRECRPVAQRRACVFERRESRSKACIARGARS